jgi:sulfatase maturation enzyme AslB (radical SAM superfamily)
MVRSNFDRIVANIRTFQTLKKKRGIQRPELYFNYVAQRTNVAEMAAFVELASSLGVRFINFIHLIDGDEAVDSSESLVNCPDLLLPNLSEAKEVATRSGIVLYVSPALESMNCD